MASTKKRSNLIDSTVPPTLDPSPRTAPSLFQPSPLLPTASLPSSSSSLPPPSRPQASHGNYHNYYERRNAHPDEQDERLKLIPREWIKGNKVLDVGCNAGLVSIELGRDLGAAKVTGVDIDKDLVRKAKGNLDLAWSRQAPLKRLIDESSTLTQSRKRRSRSTSPPPSLAPLAQTRTEPSPFTSSDPYYFPASLGRMFGYLPPPKNLLSYHLQPSSTTTSNTVNGGGGGGGGGKKGGKRKKTTSNEWPVEVKAFPENLKLVVADWVNEELESDRESYDLIIAFSVTKWIHLQSLNSGLLSFFQKLHRCLTPGGRLILEPQPFSSYSRSVKSLSKNHENLRDNYELLKSGAMRGWRAEEGEFERVLVELVGFEKRDMLGETGEIGSTFRRPVEVYTKRGGAAQVVEK